jgi:Mut7-C ubiquitin
MCFGAMREYLPSDAQGNMAVLDVEEGSSVGDVVDRLGAPRRLVFALLVDGEQSTLDRRLTGQRSEVTLMPPFTGGRRNQGS